MKTDGQQLHSIELGKIIGDNIIVHRLQSDEPQERKVKSDCK